MIRYVLNHADFFKIWRKRTLYLGLSAIESTCDHVVTSLTKSWVNRRRWAPGYRCSMITSKSGADSCKKLWHLKIRKWNHSRGSVVLSILMAASIKSDTKFECDPELPSSKKVVTLRWLTCAPVHFSRRAVHYYKFVFISRAYMWSDGGRTLTELFSVINCLEMWNGREGQNCAFVDAVGLRSTSNYLACKPSA